MAAAFPTSVVVLSCVDLGVGNEFVASLPSALVAEALFSFAQKYKKIWLRVSAFISSGSANTKFKGTLMLYWVANILASTPLKA